MRFEFNVTFIEAQHLYKGIVKTMSPILVSISAKRMVTRVLVIGKLNGR